MALLLLRLHGHRPTISPTSSAPLTSNGFGRLPCLVLERTLSTTSSKLRQEIPPESPRYIIVPEPVLSKEIRQPIVKGHLPIPRPIFDKRSGRGKLDPAYLARTAPYSASEQAGKPPASENQAWKRRMAESRRRNLEAGLKGLWTREQEAQGVRRARRAAVVAAHRAAKAAADEEDDVLTRSSVRDAVKVTAVTQRRDAAFVAAEESAARTALVTQAKSESRRDAVQELYLAAGSFIVTSEQLEAEVEKKFSEDYWRQQGGYGEVHAWGAYGPPPKLSEMWSSMSSNSYSSLLVASKESPWAKLVKRQKIVSEELTGGKME